MIEIDDPGDPRLVDYTALTDRQLRRRVEAERGVFIVEGLLAIEALLRSRFSAASLLVTARTHARLPLELVPDGVPVYVVDDAVMRSTVGFALHRGAVASAHRPVDLDADALLRPGSPRGRGTRLLVLEGVNDHENMGAMFRNAAAFGVDAVLLDPSCADPLYRRSVRVSLGHVLGVPFARLPDWPASIARLHDEGWTTVALTPSGDVEIDQVRSLTGAPLALLLGAEGPGLSPASLRAARHRVRIGLADGVDSLNVATCAAVALHALRNRSA